MTLSAQTTTQCADIIAGGTSTLAQDQSILSVTPPLLGVKILPIYQEPHDTIYI